MPIACLITDDTAFKRVSHLLDNAGWAFRRFPSETALMRGLRHEPAELVVVDTGSDAGLEDRILSWVNNRSGEHTPVVLMCSDPAAHRVARALDAGVSDCVSRWADPLEVMARLRSAAGRSRPESVCANTSVADFLLDRSNGQVFDRGTKIALTAREFAMAWLFFANAGKTLSRETISVAVWGADEDITHRTMEQHVYKLRKKLNLTAERGVTIRALYSQGYRLEVTRFSESDSALRLAGATAARARVPGVFNIGTSLGFSLSA